MEIKVAFPSYSKTYHCNYQPTEWFLPKLYSDYIISQKNRWYGGKSPHFKSFASWSMTWVPCCLAARTMLVLSYGKPVQPEPLEELIRTAGNTTRIQLRNATWDQGEDRPTVDGSFNIHRMFSMNIMPSSCRSRYMTPKMCKPYSNNCKQYSLGESSEL